MKSWVLIALLPASIAWAKPWHGIEAGSSKRADVVGKFGQPTKVLKAEGSEILAYAGQNAIPGTTQSMFRIDPRNEVVTRIDAFPAAVIDRETIENTYGRECPSYGIPRTTCYFKRLTEDFHPYFEYPKIGLAVFFNNDGKTVQSIVFAQLKPEGDAGSASRR